MIEHRRQEGLCFKCGEKYYRGHQCRKQLLFLEGEEEDGQEEEDTLQPLEEDNGEISLHAMKGWTNSKIIKVEGKMGGSKLMVLIDSGSTHSFLDEGTARRMKCPLVPTQPLTVTVANVVRS